MSSRAFGVTAGLAPEVCEPLAARCQELGYVSMWSNDHPGASGLETLAEFAKGAPTIDLGVGVIAIDRTPPEQIAADIDRLGPLTRLAPGESLEHVERWTLHRDIQLKEFSDDELDRVIAPLL